MVPVVLDELTSHGRQIVREKVVGFLAAVFEVADAVDRKEDEERGFAMANTFLRLHWLIRRVTEDRFTLEEKSTLYLTATEHAALGWLTDFVSAGGQRGQSRDLLDHVEAVPILVERALTAIRRAAGTGALLQRRDLMHCLYRWREFAEDGGAEVKAWLADQMQREEVLVLLAKSLTGESWTTGLGGFGSPGDRVSRRQVRAQIGGKFDLFDPSWFRAELEHIVREKRVPEEDVEAVHVFLTAWEKGNSRDQE